MSSQIEEMIIDFEKFVDGCKYQMFSSTHVVVNKEDLENFLSDLRLKTPKEIEACQNLLVKKEDILNQARERAQAILSEANVQTNELINEHEIMQKAYEQADEIVSQATSQAQEILDHVIMESDAMKIAAHQYTDDMLAHVESVIVNAMNSTSFKYQDLMESLGEYHSLIVSNRMELGVSEEYSEQVDVEE